MVVAVLAETQLAVVTMLQLEVPVAVLRMKQGLQIQEQQTLAAAAAAGLEATPAVAVDLVFSKSAGGSNVLLIRHYSCPRILFPKSDFLQNDLAKTRFFIFL